MKHLSKRIAALALALAMTLTLTSWASAADYADMPDNWAKAPMEAAVEAGLIQGNNGRLDPTGLLTRAQMAAILVRAFGATQSGDISGLKDVKANDWFVKDNSVPGAVFMQIMTGNDDGTFEPNKAITREQAFAVLARALKLEAGVAEDLNKFRDGDKVSSWFVGEIAAMTKAGYVNGSDGWLNPKNNISRQEFAQVMYNIFGVYINEAGTYTEVGTKAVMISAADATIENATIHGDVIIGEGVGEGDVFFKNTTIEGRVVVRGGGVNSIHFISSSTDSVLVAKIEGPVRIVMDEASEVSTVAVNAGKDTVTVEGNVRAIAATSETPVIVKNGTVTNVEVATSAAVTLDNATIGTLAVNAAEANVTLTNSATVHTLDVDKEATGVTVKGETGTQVGIINSDVDMTLSGDVAVTEINGDGVVSDDDGEPVVPNPDVPLPDDAEDVFCTHNWVADKRWKTADGTPAFDEANVDGDGVVTIATCAIPGLKQMVCTLCGATKTETIEPTGKHIYKEGAEPGVTEGATPVMVDAKNHKYVCINCGYEKTEAHKLAEDTKTCACGYKAEVITEPEDNPITAKHDHEWVVDETKTTTSCSATYKITYKCTHSEGTKGEESYKECSATKEEMSAPIDHTWATNVKGSEGFNEQNPETDANGWITVPGTCVEIGGKMRTCSVCDFEEDVFTGYDRNNHPKAKVVADGVAKDATCGVDGLVPGKICQACNTVIEAKKVIPATGNHTWGDADANKVKTCETCGAKQAQDGHEHVWNTEGDDQGKCKTCGAECPHKNTETKSVAANVTTGEGADAKTEYKHTTTVTCKDCKKVVSTKTEACKLADMGGSGKAPTCTGAGKQLNKKCSVCEQVVEGKELPAKGHSWVNGVCTVCHTTCEHESASGEKFVAKDATHHYETCAECGMTLTEAGNVKECAFNTSLDNATNSTCTVKGHEADMKCACGNVKKGAEKALADHTVDEWTYDTDSDPRTHSGTCSVCNTAIKNQACDTKGTDGVCSGCGTKAEAVTPPQQGN